MARPSLTSLLDDPVWAMEWYFSGHFPLYDLLGRFYWECLDERAFLRINADTAARAAAMSHRAASRFTLRRNTAFDACITHLRDPAVKEHTWVRDEVVQMYQSLRAAGLLVTVEAYGPAGALAGGLIGLLFPGVFVAETMFSLAPDASKVCLCSTVEMLYSHGFTLMDVQTPHDRDPWGHRLGRRVGHTPHPCVRLGERVWRVDRFVQIFQRAVRRGIGGKRSFDAAGWVALARQARATAEAWRGAPGGAVAADFARAVSRDAELAAAYRWLRLALPAEFVAAVDAALGVPAANS